MRNWLMKRFKKIQKKVYADYLTICKKCLGAVSPVPDKNGNCDGTTLSFYLKCSDCNYESRATYLLEAVYCGKCGKNIHKCKCSVLDCYEFESCSTDSGLCKIKPKTKRTKRKSSKGIKLSSYKTKKRSAKKWF